MRPLPIRTASADSTPLALRSKSSLRKVLATAAAVAIGFVPAVMVASPAAAQTSVTYTVVPNGPVTEGSPVTFTISRAATGGATLATETVTFTLTGTAAGGGVDYNTPTLTATFTNTATATDTTPVSITTINDTLDEAQESIILTVVSSTLGTATSSPATALIDDNDSPPAVTIAGSPVIEGDTGSSDKTFVATLGAISGQPVTVGWTTTAQTPVGTGEAVAGKDYTTRNGTLVFPAGTLQQTFTVPILGDTIDEGAGETFEITFTSSDSTANVSASPYAVTITDDDAVPTFTVADLVYTEQDGVSVALLPVRLSGASDTNATFSIADNGLPGDAAEEASSVAAGSDDFDTPATPVTIAAGQTVGYAFIPVNGDEIFESNESTHFLVTSTSGAATGAAKAPKLTLANDDEAPDLEITSVTGVEGETVALEGIVTGVAQGDTLLNVALSGASVNGSDAAEVDDFTNPGAIGVTIAGGTASGTVVDVADVVLAQDTTSEVSETILVTGNGFGGSGTVTNGVITIAASDGGVDPSPTPTVSPSVTPSVDPSATPTVSPSVTPSVDPSATPTVDPTMTPTVDPTDPTPDPTDPTEEPTEPVEPTDPTLTAPPFSNGVGDISLYGTATAGTEVELYGAPVGGGELVLLDSTTADDEQNYEFSATLDSTGFIFQTKADGLLSETATVWLKHRPTITLTQSGSSVVVRVIGNPKFEGLNSIIQMYINGAWRKVSMGAHGANGIYTRSFHNMKRGGYSFRAYTIGNAEVGLQGGYAAYKRIIL